MKKREILLLLGKNQTELGEILGVGRAAVSKWDDDEAIPRGRWYELCAKFPDIFGETPDPYASGEEARAVDPQSKGEAA